MTGLAPIDGVAVLAVFAKAMGYGAALLAMGSVLFTFVFASRAEPEVLRLARRVAVGAALLGLMVLAIRFGIRAARISGMGLEGATDPMMLGFVWHSPLGTAAIWRGLGEVAILALFLPGIGRWIALAGSLAVAISYTQVGHTLGDPRVPLVALLTLHLLTAAFWVGALIPLRRATRSPDGADLLHSFGVIAAYAVGLLVAAGVALSWLLSGSLPALLGTAYGWVLLTKVSLVTGLLGLAALNKWRLVPALRSGDAMATAKLRRSISIEMAFVVLILLVTATITSVTTPPLNL
ncbi:CopD family protein [uncultured Roseobacter sp.]|uniref:CopD family protein n=1 Tax=uncultured Roseobacter sp. TaxID=114847 RepID=UPI002604B129|nr:CopD family protein [uncultured Roseobacter sp.]